MNKATTLRDPEALAFLTLLPNDGASRLSAADEISSRGRHSFQQRLWTALTVYVLTVAGASGALFLIGVLLRRW